MRGTVAKRLRRRAELETINFPAKQYAIRARRGNRFLKECTRVRYLQLKKEYLCN